MRVRMEEESITFSRHFDELLDYATKYPHCAVEAQHMILSNIIDRIDVFRGYVFHVRLSEIVEQLLQNHA